MNKHYFFLLFFSVFALSCKKEERNLKEIQEQQTKDFLGESFSNFTRDTSGLYYQILEQPTGDSITNTSQVFYHQNIKTTEGTPILNNDKFNYIKAYLTDVKPIGFNKTIFALVKKGGKIRGIIPSYLAFGKDGSGSLIKGNALIDATFEVINANTAEAAEDSIITRFKKNLDSTFVRDVSGVYYNVITPGNGTEEVTQLSKITVNYVGRFLNGQQFDSSTAGAPLQTTFIGVIKGWQILTKIKKGGKMRILIPSAKAYGATGKGVIPSNCPLDFEIELVDVK